MRTALALGPDHCPATLFAGPIDAIVRGLKAHANHISHARHVAFEDTYPRTRALLGSENFHRAAETHLSDPTVLRQPPARVGIGFPARLTGAGRDLAAVEWAWLEAHGSADAIALDLAAIAGLTTQQVAAAIVSRHPAVRHVDLACPAAFAWDGSAMPAVTILVSRPREVVFVTAIDPAVRLMIEQLDRPLPLGDLLERDPAATTALVTTGALMIHPETL